MYFKPNPNTYHAKTTIVLMVMAIIFLVLRLPSFASFGSFALGDAGASLRADYILSQGYRPSVDFSYAYGLLNLVIGRAWFSLFGRTSASYIAAMVICQLLFAWGIARFAKHTNLKPVVLIFLAFSASYCFGHLASTVYALEPIFISHAFAEHASGRRRRALLIALISIFVKPSMGIVYTILILFFMGLCFYREKISFKELINQFIPISIVTACLITYLAISFGPLEFLNVTIPIAARKIYEANNFGFLLASSFYRPEGANLNYYLGNPIGFWIVLSISLLIGGAISVYRVIRKYNNINDEVIISCTICWLAWVIFFFAHPNSWFYYTYIMIMGVAVILNQVSSRRISSIFFASLLTFCLLSQYAIAKDISRSWLTRSINADTYWLWFDNDMHTEWQKVIALIGDEPTAGALFNGCLGLIDTKFLMPHYWMMLRGETNPKMLLELDLVISKASHLVLSQSDERFLEWYETNRQNTSKLLNQFKVSFEGEFFKVLSRSFPNS